MNIAFFKKTVLFLVLIFGISVSSFAQKTQISVNQLPETAQSFIKNHFKNDTVSYVIKEEEYLVIDEYKVILSNGTKIEFNAKGNWKEVSYKSQGLNTSFISKNILNHINKAFPNTFIVKIEKKNWKYEVELSNGLELEFDLEGNFKKIDD